MEDKTMENICTNYKEYPKEALKVVDLLLSSKDEFIDWWYQNYSGFRFYYNYLSDCNCVGISDADFWGLLETFKSNERNGKRTDVDFHSSLNTQFMRYQLMCKDEYFEPQEYIHISDSEYEYYFFEVEGVVYAFKSMDEIVDLSISKYKLNGYYLIYVEYDKFGTFLTFRENQSHSLSAFWENGMKSFRRAISTGILTMEEIADEYVFEVSDVGGFCEV